MGVGAVTIRGTTVTDNIHLDTALAEEQANRLNGIFAFVYRDETGAFTPREMDEVLLFDDAVRIGGYVIKTLAPRLDGKAVEWTVKATSFDALLDLRTIETLVRTGTRNDSTDVIAIAAYAGDLGITTASYVSTISSLTADRDYSGMTVRKALDTLAAEVGATYWVDENKALHWLDPRTALKVVNGTFDTSASSWSLDAAAVWTASTGPAGTGDGALVTTGSGVGSKESNQLITGITGSRRYLFFADVWSSVAAKGQVRLDWLNAASVSQRVDTLAGTGTSAWSRVKAVYTAPASADRVRVYVGGVAAFTGTVRHDNVTLIGEDAAFGIDTTPNGTTTYAPRSWSQPSDATSPVNRVLIIGNGISGWREHAASIAYYGGVRYEGVLNDDRVTTTAGIDSRAAYVFRKYAFPAHSGTYRTYVTGLRAGRWQLIKIDQTGTLAIEWIATLRIRWDGNGRLDYEVVYGEPEEDLGAAMAAVQTTFDGSNVGINTPPVPGGDVLAPAVPTGLALTTSTVQAPDGTLRPYILAAWTASPDTDLDAYELDLDRAITGTVAFTASASGTGGTLAAGTYLVEVVGVGAGGGTTAGQTQSTSVTLTAGQKLNLVITAKAGCTAYRVYASIPAIGETEPKGLATLTGAVTETASLTPEVTAAGSASFPPATSTAVAFINPTTIRTGSVSVYTEDVLGGTYYAGRVRAIDGSGNRSAYSAVTGVVAGADTTLPGVPAGLAATAGFRLVGLTWTRSGDVDLARYEVRYAPDNGTGTAPDTTLWTAPFATSGTSIVITGLNAGTDVLAATRYYFQLRAVDRSGNASAWSNDVGFYISAVPSRIGSADIAAGSVTADRISAAGIDAGLIKSGSLQLGGTASTPDYLLVYNAAGQEIGRWDANGLLVKDPTSTLRQMRLVGGVMSFSADGGSTWTTAISADGITADAIKVGIGPGGHNAIPNASFELAAFVSVLQNTWEADSPWSGSIGTDVNVTKNTPNVTVTNVTYP